MNLKRTPTLKSCKIKLGITIGDPSGIGPYITLRAIHKLKGLADFVVIGDEWVFKKVSSIQYPVSSIQFIDLKNVPHKNFSFGKIKAEYGKASVEYLDKALELLKQGKLDCLVTCPISKEAWNLAGFKYSGHTEYLARQTNAKDYTMMLLNKYLKIVLATRHIPISSVSKKLQADKLYKTILITYQSLKKLFLLKNPRMVICGLNPHASDNGLIGNEENLIIKPVLKKLKGLIKYIYGPMSSDVAISKAYKHKYDCVIAMYHDQALIPLKLLDNRSGVNLTLGLPFIRTSPLHGTALDIAKNQSADPSSLIEAVSLAIRCTLNLRRP